MRKPVFAYPKTKTQYTVIFHGCKNDYLQIKKYDSFLNFALKHRAWVHVRTASAKILYLHCYIPSFPAQVFTIQSQNNVSQSSAEGLPCYNTITARQLRHCRAVMVLQPCITISKQSQNNVSQSLAEGLPGCNLIAARQ